VLRGKKGFYTAILLACSLIGVSGCSRNSENQGEGPLSEAAPSVPVQEFPEESAHEESAAEESVTDGPSPETPALEETSLPSVEETSPEAPGVSTAEIPAPSDIPEALRIPRRGEAPRFPRDRLIGPLGRGDADAGAYRYAWNFLESLLIPENREDVLSGFPDAEELERILEEVQPGSFRMGSAQDEGDNGFSFLVRFMGSEKSSAGEVYVRLVNERWTCEDILLEEEPEGEISRFDYPSYQRFF
jgi:hypothetical protein